MCEIERCRLCCPGEKEAYLYPDWALALGWLITLFPMLLIVGYFGFRYCKDGGWLVRTHTHVHVRAHTHF